MCGVDLWSEIGNTFRCNSHPVRAGAINHRRTPAGTSTGSADQRSGGKEDSPPRPLAVSPPHRALTTNTPPSVLPFTPGLYISSAHAVDRL